MGMMAKESDAQLDVLVEEVTESMFSFLSPPSFYGTHVHHGEPRQMVSMPGTSFARLRLLVVTLWLWHCGTRGCFIYHYAVVFSLQRQVMST